MSHPLHDPMETYVCFLHAKTALLPPIVYGPYNLPDALAFVGHYNDQQKPILQQGEHWTLVRLHHATVPSTIRNN